MEVWQYIIAAVLVALSGLFSGLNLGLMSFAPEDLRIVIEGSPDESERRAAAKIQPLRKTGNLLLCTLLLGNTLVNAAIATLLADATAGVLGMFITTGLIVVFGEIVPQSVCSRYALQIGAASVPLVWLFVGITFPVAYPIAKALDWALGGEMSAVYTKGELQSLIRINVEDPQRVKESGLTPEDGKLLTGALSFKEELVEGAMTPLDAVFSLPEETILDEDTMGRILKSGHTRIPVTSEGKAVAILYAKDLVGVGFERNLALKSVLDAFDAYKRVYNVYEKTSLGDCFALCKRERRHLLVVVEKISKSLCGIVTTEDILEEILQDEIVGDDDQYIDQGNTSSMRPGLARQNSKAYDPLVLMRQLSPRRGMTVPPDPPSMARGGPSGEY